MSYSGLDAVFLIIQTQNINCRAPYWPHTGGDVSAHSESSDNVCTHDESGDNSACSEGDKNSVSIEDGDTSASREGGDISASREGDNVSTSREGGGRHVHDEATVVILEATVRMIIVLTV